GDDPAEAVATRRRDDPGWFMHNVDGLDWDSIALVMPHRTPSACKIQWLYRDCPALAARAVGSGGASEVATWTRDERERFDAAVERWGAREGRWREIAREVGLTRTPAMCARRWRLHGDKPAAASATASGSGSGSGKSGKSGSRPGNKKVERKVWTRDEDERLKRAVQQWGENWDVVARHTSFPAGPSRLRFLNSLRPSLAHGRFTPAEDALVVAAVGAFGTHDWAKVARRLEGRTEVQCRERWGRGLDPRIRGGSKGWTGEEDDLLVELYEVDNLGWAEISHRAFGGERSAAHVARRYEALRAEFDPEGAEAARAVRNKKDQERRARRREEKEKEKAALGLGPKKKRGRPPKKVKVQQVDAGEEDEEKARAAKRVKVE
ncbi:hypothetical protein JCM8208_006286, partial [Rhodotorula glutinis]